MIDQKHRDLMQEATDLINTNPLPANAMDLFDAIYNKGSELTKNCLEDLRTALTIEMEEQGLMDETPENKSQQVAAAASATSTSVDNDLPEPSQAQKVAGNYKKGRFELNGLLIIIENPKDSTRSGQSPDGQEWANILPCHYGDIAKTSGADGDKVDCFVGGHVMSERVFIIDQMDPKTRDFDEHKVMLGFDNEDSARMNYLAAYDEGWQGIGAITEVTFDALKEWLKGDTSQPYSSELS